MTKKNTKRIEPKLGDEIPENMIKEATKQIKAQYKTVILDDFRSNTDVEIRIYQPTAGVESVAADAYSNSFNKLLRDSDLMTKKQLRKVLEKRGDWTEESDKEVEDIREDMRLIELEVAHMRKKKTFNRAIMSKLRKKWTDKRETINTLLSEQSSLLSNSIEGRSEEKEAKVKLSFCVKFPDESYVWQSVEELNDEKERIAVVKVYGEALLFWAGLTQEIIDDLPARILFGGEETLEN